jgi:arsenate reductase (thioredoxin)
MKKVLFICVHNSARSQMAEAFLKKYGAEYYTVESAGIEAGELNPYVVQVLKEDEKIDISNNETKSAMDFYKHGKLFQYVVTLCDESSERCPIFPGIRERLIMNFKDPATFTGTEDEILNQVRELKNHMKKDIHLFIDLEVNGKLRENMPSNWKIS